MCVWQAAAEKLIQYARTDEEREKLIAKHRELLNKMLDDDDDLEMDSEEAGPSPGGGFSPLPPTLSEAVNNVAQEKRLQ